MTFASPPAAVRHLARRRHGGARVEPIGSQNSHSRVRGYPTDRVLDHRAAPLGRRHVRLGRRQMADG